MTTDWHLVILLEQATRQAARADPGLAAKHQRVALALIEAIKKESRRGRTGGESWTAIPYTQR